jgi:hypothetical protein
MDKALIFFGLSLYVFFVVLWLDQRIHRAVIVGTDYEMDPPIKSEGDEEREMWGKQDKLRVPGLSPGSTVE